MAKNLPHSHEMPVQVESANIDTDSNIQIISTHLLLPQGSISNLIGTQFGNSNSLEYNNANQFVNIDEIASLMSNINDAQPSTSSLPSSEPFLGQHQFRISLATTNGPVKKTAAWTYSKQLNKLYCSPSVACPVEITISGDMPPYGTVVRAMPVFSKAEHVQQLIKRCENHKNSKEFDTDLENLAALDHFVRLKHADAAYMIDSVSKRHSVVIPFEKPQPGSTSTTIFLQFMCYSSCVGGTLKPVKTILTLEYNGQILGRGSFEVKICACPGRDRATEEKRLVKKQSSVKKNLSKVESKLADKQPVDEKKQVSSNQLPTSSLINSLNNQRATDNDDEMFTLKIRGRKTYEMLSQLNEALELQKIFSSKLHESNLATNQAVHQSNIASLSKTESCKNSNANEAANELHRDNMPQSSNPLFLNSKQSSLMPSLSFLDSSFFLRPESFMSSSKRKVDVLAADARPQTLEGFLESIDMSAYYNLISSKGIDSLESLLSSNKKVINSLKISKSDTNKLCSAIDKFVSEQAGASSSTASRTTVLKESSFLDGSSKRTRLSTFREKNKNNDTLPLNTSFVDFLGSGSFSQPLNVFNQDLSIGDSLVKLSKYQVKYSFGMKNNQLNLNK